MNQAIKKGGVMFACCCWVLIVSGCGEQQGRPDRANVPGPASATSDPVALRFQEGASHSQTVVQSAVELSEKYSAL